MNMKAPLMVIAGPTASGKSALALALSRLMPVTIINADASQVYADLRIISARPSAEEEAEAPHRLFGTIDGAAACSAAHWASLAKSEIEEAVSDGRLPVLVGGTGLYLRTLLDGIAPVPEIDPEVRKTVRGLPTEEAYAQLQNEDSEAAARLAPQDSTRIARALEVVRSTGRPLAQWQQDLTGGIADGFSVTGALLLPPRDWLYARCDERFIAMAGDEGKAEVKALLARNLDPDLPVMRAIGVREVAALLNAPDQAPEHIAAGQQATRNYAKRQYTWFRNQPPPDWERIEVKLNTETIKEIAIKLRQKSLTS
jgi:tRNA dimethylallyltransferase